jgi:hypothetical protein
VDGRTLVTYDDIRNHRDPSPRAGDDVLPALLASRRPLASAAVGLGGLGLITWLMMFKPF